MGLGGITDGLLVDRIFAEFDVNFLKKSCFAKSLITIIGPVYVG